MALVFLARTSERSERPVATFSLYPGPSKLVGLRFCSFPRNGDIPLPRTGLTPVDTRRRGSGK